MNTQLIVIPTYNERKNIIRLLSENLLSSSPADILIVDDQSPDGTADLVELHYLPPSPVTVLRRTGTRGLGLSYIEAFQYSLQRPYQQILQMDADFSHDPQYLPRLLQAAQGVDVVIGSRYCPGGATQGWPLHRHLLSRLSNLYLHALLPLPVRDATSGFRCYSRHALEQINLSALTSTGFAFQVEMTYKAARLGLSMVEVPITFVERRHGQSKMTLKIIAEAARLPWRLRSRRSSSPELPRND